MTLEIYDKLKALASSLSESVMSFKDDDAYNAKLLESIDDMIFNLATNIRQEAGKHIDNNDFEQATQLYYALSELLSKCAEHAKRGTQVHSLLSNNATSWSGYARRTAYTAINYYIERALQFEREGDYKDDTERNHEEARKKYKECTEYKNKAKALEYNIENGKIRGEASSFVFPLFSKTLSSMPESNHTITPDQINIVNRSNELKKRKEGWYQWSVYLDNERSILDQIEYVKYFLHPTFLKPEYKRKNPANRFRLDATGWGEFEIKVDINLKQGQTITKYHWLDLTSDDKDQKQVSTSNSSEQEQEQE